MAETRETHDPLADMATLIIAIQSQSVKLRSAEEAMDRIRSILCVSSPMHDEGEVHDRYNDTLDIADAALKQIRGE